jgi:hypothetical protein
MNNTYSSLYEKTSIKQLLKKLKYAKEKYYSTLSPEAREVMEYIKLKIAINSGNSKYVYKNVVNTKEKKIREAKRAKKRRMKEKKKKEREAKRERNRIKEEELKRKFKKAQEEFRRQQEREAKERAERQAKEEWERYKAEKEFEMNLPQDILEFKNNPIKKVWRNLIIKYHPDKGGNEELMKIINSIWETFTGKY